MQAPNPEVRGDISPVGHLSTAGGDRDRSLREAPAAAVAMGRGVWGVMGGPQEREVPTPHCPHAAAINRAVITTAAVWSP